MINNNIETFFCLISETLYNKIKGGLNEPRK